MILRINQIVINHQIPAKQCVTLTFPTKGCCHSRVQVAHRTLSVIDKFTETKNTKMKFFHSTHPTPTLINPSQLLPDTTPQTPHPHRIIFIPYSPLSTLQNPLTCPFETTTAYSHTNRQQPILCCTFPITKPIQPIPTTSDLSYCNNN